MVDHDGGVNVRPNPESTERSAVWICSFLPESTGAGVERFASMLAAAVFKTGRKATVVDIGSIGGSQKLARGFRYYAAWRIGRLLRKLAKPGDIIICSNFMSWNAPRKRSAVVFHGTDIGRVRSAGTDMSFLRRAAVRSIGTFLERRTAKGRTIVAVSRSAKNEVESNYALRVDAVIPNGVDLGLFSPSKDKVPLRRKLGLPQDKFLALFVGTDEPRKGLGWILKELLPRFEGNLHLVVRSNLADPHPNTTVVKRLATEELADLYRACDALLFPTQYEGYSFVLVEAIACGLPPVTSSAGGGSDLKAVPELEPYIIDDRSPETYMRCLQKLAGSPEERIRVSRAARDYAEKNCSIEQFERSYIGIIEQLERGGSSAD